MNVGEVVGGGEATVVLVGEGCLQEVIGLLDGRHVLFPEELDETVLLSAIGTFDTALGLGRMGTDMPDAE